MTGPSGELTSALQRFGQLFDPAAINARQAHSPATIYTPAVVVWLMVYQRLHERIATGPKGEKTTLWLVTTLLIADGKSVAAM